MKISFYSEYDNSVLEIAANYSENTIHFCIVDEEDIINIANIDLEEIDDVILSLEMFKKRLTEYGTTSKK